MIDTGGIAVKLSGFPEEEAEDISRCLTTLYSVRTGEQPLDREFGIDNTCLDQPLNIAKNLFALEIIEKTKKYEPRVSITKVEYNFDINGRLIPTIFCERGDGR